MSWRKGKPVDAATAPAQQNVKSGSTTFDSAVSSLAAPEGLECRTIGFISPTGNIGTVYIGDIDVNSPGGFPVSSVGIFLDVNQAKNPIYGIADTSGDVIRWISIL